MRGDCPQKIPVIKTGTDEDIRLVKRAGAKKRRKREKLCLLKELEWGERNRAGKRVKAIGRGKKGLR